MPDVTMTTDELREALSRGSTAELSTTLAGLHPADVAELVADLDADEKAAVFEAMEAKDAGEMLDEADLVTQEDILGTADERQVVRALEELPPDEAADVLDAVSEERAEQLVDQMEDGEAQDVEELLDFPPDSAGRIMNNEFPSLSAEMTAREAVHYAQESLGPEATDDIYVVDTEEKLVGRLPLRALLFARPETTVGDLAETDVVRATVETDQEEVTRLVSKYDLLSVPVCDGQNRLRGIITVDDVIEVIEEEVSEDMYRLAGTAERDPLHRSVLGKAWLRAPWLGVSLVGGIFCCSVVGQFEASLHEAVALAFFLPLIPLMGGNVAIQASTIIVRGLATGEISRENVMLCTVREIATGLLLGLVCGTASGLAALLLTGEPMLGQVVGCAVCCSIISAATFGSTIPLLCTRLRADPAIAAGPFVTIINDLVGVGIYLSLATLLLSRLRT